MKRERQTKIVATLGPASSDAATIEALFRAGADTFRLNFSHGTHAGHKKRLGIIRRLERLYARPIGIIADMQGPKIRVGLIEGGVVDLAVGQEFRLDTDPAPGDATRVQLPHPEVFKALEPGIEILLDDGRLRLSVKTCGADFAETRVVTGGRLSNNKGVNLPGTPLDLSPITAKDREDLQFALEMGADWIALSFIQFPKDVAEARQLVAGRAAILVKLEKPSAIQHLDEIVELADAVMVARGDLGVEMPPEDVPVLQRTIVHSCRMAGKPVIVATQMLESMVHAPTPTRAEASDVATAVYEGADAVMLSAESAAGDYPVEAVSMMDRIIRRIENDPLWRQALESEQHGPTATVADAITAAARQTAETVSAAAIVTFTATGSTTLRAARERPTVPILAFTPKAETARRLTLAWGVHCVRTGNIRHFTEMVNKAIQVAREQGLAAIGDRLVITAGIPSGIPGTTTILHIVQVA
jgi:pyruvate kinase